MAGLHRICKSLGGMTVWTVNYVWDYANNYPVTAEEMPVGSDRWKTSERAKWEHAKDGDHRSVTFPSGTFRKNFFQQRDTSVLAAFKPVIPVAFALSASRRR